MLGCSWALRCASQPVWYRDRPEASLLNDDPRSIHSWELHLIMEFCDAGPLRTALKQKRFIDNNTPMGRNVAHVIMTALDVARGKA